MPIPQSLLEEIRARIALPTLVGRTVRLTKVGRNWKGCCPFHSEKSPSFYVYEEGFHCFGCGAHGDAVAFVMQAQGLSDEDAVAALAAEAGFQVPGQQARKGSDVVSTPAEDVKGDAPKIKNESSFPAETIDAVLATAARLLVRQGQVRSASILANASGRLTHWNHDSWDGGQDTWRLTLAVPAAVFFDLDGKGDREKEIGSALDTAIKVVSLSDFFEVSIVTALDGDPDWRRKVNQHLGGEGLTNQGRVRSDNIAAIERDGLLFRSRPEVHFYEALKRAGVPFAPLSVVLHGGLGAKSRRVEPDFIVYKDGIAMIVEIDGDLFHRETPATAHARLKFLTDEGLRLERINASACDTPEKAREAVDRVLATLDKLRRTVR